MKDVIDMEGFIEWSFDHDAQTVLLQGLPPHPQGSQYARLELRNKLALLRVAGPVAAGVAAS
jgi:hypothetical protein